MQKLKRLIIILIIFCGVLLINNTVKATTISVTPDNPKVGDTITVTVTVPNVHTASVFVKVSGAASGGISVVGGDLAGEIKTYSKTATYKCNSAGTIYINTEDRSSAVLNGSYVNVSASKSVTVSEVSNNASSNSEDNSNTSNGNNTTSATTPASKPQEPVVSNDASLKNLGIRPNDFTGFKRATLSYDVTVPNDVGSVEVYATPNNDKATVTGTGKKELKEGKNTFEVKVTAEDGKTTKTYTLNITRQTAEETAAVNTEIPKEEDIIGLTDLKVKGFEITPVFDNSKYEYKLDIDKDLSELDIETKTSGDNIKVDIVGNSELQEGENVITLLVYNAEIDDTVTYQIIVNKKAVTNDNTSGIDISEYNSLTKEAQNELKKKIIIISGTVGFIIVAILIFIIAKAKINKKNNVKESKISKVNKDERIDLNKDNELFTRVNQKENENNDKLNKESEKEIIETENKPKEKDVYDMDLESQLKKVDEESNAKLTYSQNALDDFENMDNLEEFLRKMKDNK